MDTLHPTYPARRASSTMSRPRPKERSMTSSSTGSIRLQRREAIPSPTLHTRPSRPHQTHRESTTSYHSYRSRRGSSFSADPMVEAFSEGEGSIEAEEEWERGETVRQVKSKKKKDEPMSPVTVVRKSSPSRHQLVWPVFILPVDVRLPS